MVEKKKVLIVEDEELIQKFFVEILEYKYEVHVANNGDEGIKLAKKIVPEMILLDIMMPQKDGFEVCTLLRNDKAFEKSIIIMVTGLSDRDSKMKALKMGADDIISKPFNPIDVRTKVQLMFRLRDRLLSLSSD
ncbi:MAG: response regulator [Bacteroidetes bacterium]|nr:response regulator [Bacteroidota bacterium]